MSESDSLSQKQKKATFGVVFLTIFMDMVGFSVIFPLFPSMLDHYLSREAAMGGGLVTNFVEMVKGYAFEGAEGDGGGEASPSSSRRKSLALRVY